MIIHEQGYKVTVTRVGQSRGKFHSCWPVRWMAEQEARSIIKADPMVEAVRVYSRNRAEFHYGICVCLRLVRDLDGIIAARKIQHAKEAANRLAESQVIQAVIESK